MAKAKLKTENRVTSVSREAVRAVVERTAQTGKFVSIEPKSPIGQAVKKKIIA